MPYRRIREKLKLRARLAQPGDPRGGGGGGAGGGVGSPAGGGGAGHVGVGDATPDGGYKYAYQAAHGMVTRTGGNAAWNKPRTWSSMAHKTGAATGARHAYN